MNFINYIKDKVLFLILFFLLYGILLLLFFAFKIQSSLILAITFLFFTFLGIIILIDYFRKKTFYQELLLSIEKLDKAYYVVEMIEEPVFYEGKLFYQALYDINKSMCEMVKILENQTDDFKDYIEMWIHEVKIPIASLVLMAHNHPDKFDKNFKEQIKRIEDYVEQVLYYVRQEFAEKDYFINSVSLKKVIANVALKNKNDFLESKIDLIVENVDCKVYTDSKWLEFILNQIIGNSIKYKKEKNSIIKITVEEDLEKCTLIVEDNGIGIPETDLSSVFEKSFTGNNGRRKGKSTGMGLYIVKKLCDKLGHQVKIESQEGEYTKLFLVFSKNKYYDVIQINSLSEGI